MTPPGAAAGRPRSRAVATWLALVGGGFGLHRFYLHGGRDVWAWLHPWPTLVGAYGFWRMREFGVDDARGSLLVPFLGVMLATTLNNGGGAWDNAKKYIESGNLKDDNGNVIGKGSDAHAAAVVGDTVGDPFKDTAGPSLHVLVKLLATITLVLAPLFIR